MNRLWVRLTVAFIVVTQLSIFVVAALANWTVTGEFRTYVIRREFSSDGAASSFFYTQWAAPLGVGTFSHSQPVIPGAPAPLVEQGAITSDVLVQGITRAEQTTVTKFLPLLTDAKGVVIYDPGKVRIGTVLDKTEMAVALPIKQNGANGTEGKLVGYLYPNPSVAAPIPPPDLVFRTPEQDFLNRLSTTLLISALLVGTLGVLVGLVISRTLIAPLANLADAARAFATHDWSHRLKTRGASEIAAVARAFNEMADEIQRAEMLRRNLIADIAHELRTPLTVMRGNLRALLDDVYPLDKAEIATLYEETDMLNRLVDDLRELARADAGQLNLDLEAVDTQELLDTTLANFAIAAESQDVQIVLESPDNLACVRADAGRMTQILLNFLSNALRHANGGTVKVSACVLPGQRNMVCISVADNGEGIKPEDLPHIFDRFYRADKSRARSSGNSGLGLAIARAWVEAMGGKIGVESVYGQGSRFWFALPVMETLTQTP